MDGQVKLLSSEELLSTIKNTVGDNIAEEVYDEIDALEQYSVKWSHSVSWKGYEVYSPFITGSPKIGLALVILVKAGSARMSTPDEALEYLDYENRGNLKAKNTRM